MKQLVDEFYPKAQKARVVTDNLSTHHPAGVYQVFGPNEAKRLLARLEFHYTPKHGSWLNMAETEFSVLTRQRLGQRIPDASRPERKAAEWEEPRNASHSKVNWRFTTGDARIKLKQVYPSYEV